MAGFVLQMSIMLLLAVGVAVGFFLYAASQQRHVVRRWHASDHCLLDAQSALEMVKYELVQAYRASSSGSSWFHAWDLNWIGSNPVYHIPDLPPTNGSALLVRIAAVNVLTNAGYAEVELLGAAARSAPYAVNRIINETLRINFGGAMGTVQPFEYAYLLNNSGQLRNNMVVNGDIRVNGAYRLSNASVVNGNRYASGQLTANAPLWSVAAYWNPANTPLRARPTSPAGPDNIEWPMGYLPDKSKNAFLPAFAIPVVDDINAMAENARGKLVCDGVELAVNFYDGVGPDGIAGTADDHCLILGGSAAPVTIQGTVVVKGDLIIKGRIAGQGAIYAGRNVHIVGDLSYVNPPAWPKPDSRPDETASNNAGKDLLVLAAKGNIVVGNYTSAAWSNRVWGIMNDPSRINASQVLASDAAIGYDSDNNSANGYLFDGRYYLNEAHGGRRLSGVGTNTVPRKYYESSLANSAFNAFCDANNVPEISAALLSSHAVIGLFGSSLVGGNAVLNGAMACRDDLSDFYGRFAINWDIRLGSESRDRINVAFLREIGEAGQTEIADTIGWREIY